MRFSYSSLTIGRRSLLFLADPDAADSPNPLTELMRVPKSDQVATQHVAHARYDPDSARAHAHPYLRFLIAARCRHSVLASTDYRYGP
jgi:hypothetical protein